jgi:hypothetical protein
MDRAYEDGLLGSRELTLWDMDMLPRDADLLRSEAESIAQDETFVAFVAAVRQAGAIVEIVSDGLGFYVASNLARLAPSLADLPIATNANAVDGPGGVTFRTGTPGASFVARASASGCARTRPPAVRWSSWATAPATGTPRTMPRSCSRRASSSHGAARPDATSSSGTGSRRSRPGSGMPSWTGGCRPRPTISPPGDRLVVRRRPRSSAAPNPGARGAVGRRRREVPGPVSPAASTPPCDQAQRSKRANSSKGTQPA